MNNRILKLILIGFSLLMTQALNFASNAEINVANNTVILRDSVRVNNKVINIGDLFINSGAKSNIAIAYAPAPGKRATFDANWLYRITKSHQINWRPMSRDQRIVVERESTIITQNQIAEELLVALSDRGINGNLEIEFSNRALRLFVAGNEVPSIGIDGLNYNPQSRRFIAMIYAPEDNIDAKRFRVTGRLHITHEIPVPKRRIMSGEIIKKEDLKWIKVRSRRLQTDIIVHQDDLIGKSPRRGLREGSPVRLTAVRRPVLVPKGSLVTITLSLPKMMLTARGKAVEGGSKGDIIQIKNIQSKIILEAEVISSGRVAVRPTTLIAMN